MVNKLVFSFGILVFLFCCSATANSITPIISEIRFDNKAYFPGDIISSRPIISALIINESGAISTIEVEIFPGKTYILNPDADFDGRIDFELPGKKKLKPGDYSVILRAWDDKGNFSEKKFDNLKVIKGLAKLKGLNCSLMSFKPSLGEVVNISYELSMEDDLRVLIYHGGNGRQVWARQGDAWGKKGLNRFAWDGKDDQGIIVPNGNYKLRIISGNKVLGSGSFIVED